MNNDLLIRALQGMRPGIVTYREFRELSGIANQSTVSLVLDLFSENGIGISPASSGKRSGSIAFSEADRLSAALLAIQHGCDIERVSALLTWKDFEGLAARALELSGYKTSRNVRFKRPKAEIDVVGYMSGVAVAVDCKHWNRRNSAAIRNAARKQAIRASRLLENSCDHSQSGKITRALPVILTLYPLPFRLADGVPVVPVVQFAAFVQEIDSFENEIDFFS